MYVKVNDNGVVKFPYSLGELRKENKNVSFPKNITEELAATFGVYLVTQTPLPSLDPFTTLTRTFLRNVELVDNVWTEVWSEELLPKEIAESNIRRIRNGKLLMSDWTQGKDVPETISNPWAVYRQALRDLTKQGGFPYAITWPTEPTE